MAKNMARLENRVVVNIEWLPDRVVETENLKEMGDVPAGIGDTWEAGKFYRDGAEVVSPVRDMENALAILLGGDAV